MPTYVYETIPPDDTLPSERFEIRQSMNERPLRKHPDTGVPVRRVISGGFGYMPPGSIAPPSRAGDEGRPVGTVVPVTSALSESLALPQKPRSR